TAVQDTVDELDESIIVDIASVTNGTESGTQQVTAIITDDDGPTIAINNVTLTEANTGSTVNANFTVTISAASPQSISVEYATATGTCTITDNDNPPTVSFSASSSSGVESVTPANLAVALSTASGKTVTINYAVTGGTATGGGVDYTLANGTLTFAPGVISQN